MSLRLYREALDELLVLKDIAPEEANVFFLLGKCYKGLGDRASAVRAYTTSLNLDAKVGHMHRSCHDPELTTIIRQRNTSKMPWRL